MGDDNIDPSKKNPKILSVERILIGITLVGAISTEVLAQGAAPGQPPVLAQEPIAGSGIVGLILGGAAVFIWYRSRKNQ